MLRRRRTVSRNAVGRKSSRRSEDPERWPRGSSLRWGRGDGGVRRDDCRVPRLRLLAWVVACVSTVSALTGVAGCGPGAEELREAADTLVPPDSRIVAREDGNCFMFADSPWCHTIGFVRPTAPLEKRVDAVREAAGQAGWELEEEVRAEGATFLDYTRGGLKASVTLWADFRAKQCGLRPRMDCADRIRVVR